MRYDPALVKPMREELVEMGVVELETGGAVDAFLAETEGTTLLVVNSVCGCAAGSARPGLRLALARGAVPDRIGTVFAGQDVEATERARSHFADLPPSSPSFALLSGGELAAFVPRHRIEGQSPESVAGILGRAFDEHCGSRS